MAKRDDDHDDLQDAIDSGKHTGNIVNLNINQKEAETPLEVGSDTLMRCMMAAQQLAITKFQPLPKKMHPVEDFDLDTLTIGYLAGQIACALQTITAGDNRAMRTFAAATQGMAPEGLQLCMAVEHRTAPALAGGEHLTKFMEIMRAKMDAYYPTAELEKTEKSFKSKGGKVKSKITAQDASHVIN